MRQRQPFIAITPNILPPADRRFYKGKALQYGEHALARAVTDAGATTAIVTHPAAVVHRDADAPELDLAALAEYAAVIAERFDGLVLSGGEDIAPDHYGEAPGHPDWAGNPARDAFELALYRAFIEAGKPVLGICRGAQLIGVAEGARLFQDIASLGPAGAVRHRCQDAYDTLGHAVELDTGTFLTQLWQQEPLQINSVHHQALATEPAALRIIARAPDGIPEAFVRAAAGPFVAGVQWHPEWMQHRPSQQQIFRHFITRCA
jgi:putative glutamine amidotransferase